MELEFSRLYNLRKITHHKSHEMSFQATTEECAAISKRLDSGKLCSLTGSFIISKNEDDTYSAEGKVRTVYLPENEVNEKSREFDILLRLIEGKQEEIPEIDWEQELTNPYDTEYFENHNVDFGEIVVQYLSLELFINVVSDEEGALESLQETHESGRTPLASLEELLKKK